MTAAAGISEQLLHQEIYGAELSTLLERLGTPSFDAPTRCRLKDVIENSGVDPRFAAAALVAIRQERWEERFGVKRELVVERQGDQSRMLSRPIHSLAAGEQRLLDSLRSKKLRDLEAERRVGEFYEKCSLILLRWYLLTLVAAAVAYCTYLWITEPARKAESIPTGFWVTESL